MAKAKSTSKAKLPKQSTTKNSESNKEINIKDFSILVDIANVIAEGQQKLNKNIDTLNKSNTKFEKSNTKSMSDISKSMKDMSGKVDSLLKEQKISSSNLKSLIEKQEESNKIAKDAAEQAALSAEFAEERIAEKERERLISQETAIEKEEKDRATIISKLTALEEKDLEVNVKGKGGGGGFGGLGDLLSGLGKLAAIAGLLTAGFMALKDLLDDIMDGSFFTDGEIRTPELLGGQAGLSGGSRAAQRATQKALGKSGKNFDRAKAAAKSAVTGKSAQPATPKPSTGSTTGSPAAQAQPKPPAQGKLTPMQRIGQGAKAGYEATKGAGRRVQAVAQGTAATIGFKPMVKTSVTGAIASGVTGAAIEAAEGGSAMDIAKAGGKAGLQGAALAAGLQAVGGLSVTAAGAVGGAAAAKVAARAVPFLGWGLLAYDVIKTALTIGDYARGKASEKELVRLQTQMNNAIKNSEKQYKEAEKIKDSDPEQYNLLVEMANNNIIANANAFKRFDAIVEAENALDQIVDMEKWAQYGPFGLWDRGSSYTLNGVENQIRYLQDVKGETTTEKINNALKSPSQAGYKGSQGSFEELKRMVDTLGVEDLSRLLGEDGQAVIKKLKENEVKSPFDYFNEKYKLEDPSKQQPPSETPPQMRKGAALIHSNSTMGTPVMAGEKGNPETIIPLNKFDEIISDYLNNKSVNLKLESKSYDDMTDYIRGSYLEERLESIGNNNVTINNISNNGGGSSGSDQAANFQFQTDLSKTFDNVFEMILEKNVRTGLT